MVAGKWKVFSTNGFYEVPKRHTFFRVGPWVGACIVSTRWFVVMKLRK